MYKDRAVFVFVSILFLSGNSHHFVSLCPPLSLSLSSCLFHTPALTHLSTSKHFPFRFMAFESMRILFSFMSPHSALNSCAHIKHMLVAVGESAEERFIVNIIMTELFSVTHFRIFVHIYQFRPQSILVFVCVPQFCSELLLLFFLAALNRFEYRNV